MSIATMMAAFGAGVWSTKLSGEPIQTLATIRPMLSLSAPTPLSEAESLSPQGGSGQCGLSKEELKSRDALYQWLGGESKVLELEGDFCEAKKAAEAALAREGLNHNGTIAIADFTKPSYLRRLLLYNPETGEESRHLVAHGKNTGNLYAKKFSNRIGSFQSSLGLYWVGKRYHGSHGESIRLHGMEAGVNDKAYQRAIVIHSAWYVSYNFLAKTLKKKGTPRLGLSLGCPSVHSLDMPIVLEKLIEGSYLYIYKGQVSTPVAPSEVSSDEKPIDLSLVF